MSQDIRRLVDQQIIKWHQMRAAQARAEKQAEKVGAQPIIALSREKGSLGRDVAVRVAKKLDFDLFDREIVEEIADNANVRAALVESVDNRVQDSIENWIGQQIGRSYFAHSDYLRHLSQVLLTIGRHGRAVILGRGAQFIANPEWTLRVRTIAPQALRIERIAARHGTSLQEARATTLRVDAERRAFAKRHFDTELGVAGHYDLILNTASLPPELCADLVARAFVGRFG